MIDAVLVAVTCLFAVLCAWRVIHLTESLDLDWQAVVCEVGSLTGVVYRYLACHKLLILGLI